MTADTSNIRLNALLSHGAGDLKKNGFDEQALLTRVVFDQSVLLRDRKEQVRQFLALVYQRWSLKVQCPVIIMTFVFLFLSFLFVFLSCFLIAFK